MKKHPFFLIGLCFIILFSVQESQAQSTSQPFEFQFENKTLKGFIETPETNDSKAIVLLIPGYGKTNFAEGRTYAKLRKKLLEYGLTVVTWDKMGCGNSEGIFDANQPVESSAREAFEAIKTIQQLEIKGSNSIGLWGLSRAGWICPLINELYPVDFWISVSGPTDKENYGYLLKSNLVIEGKTASEAEQLYQSWKLGQRIFYTGGSYHAHVNAMKPLTQDSLTTKLFGFKEVTEITDGDIQKYQQQQEFYKNTDKGHFDLESGLWVYINNFEQILSKVNCPVLAIYGEGDSQVDWKASKAMYEDAFKNRGNLTVRTFPNCNHVLQKCKTCGYREDLSAYNWAYCDGYFESMETWLRNQNFID
jgi:esterase/lipase